MNVLVSVLMSILGDKQLNALTTTINILAYLKLLSENRGTVDIVYDYLVNSYSGIIKQKFNFDIILLTLDQFESLFKLTSIETLFNDKIDYLILIMELFKSKRKYKVYYNEISNLLYTDRDVIKYIVQQIPKHKYNSILNLFSGTGGFMEYILKHDIEYTTIKGFDANEYINIICKLNMSLISGKWFDDVLKVDLLSTNILTKGDLIICDTPSNIKNLVFAECCDNIKKLKIRGTGSEALIIQLITSLLNDDGIAIVFVTNDFLYHDSKQYNSTREYLVKNFNVTNIINDNKHSKSILIFSKKNKTENIVFSNIDGTDNNVLNIANINNKYVLSHKYYFNNAILINEQNTKLKISDDNLSEKLNTNKMVIINNQLESIIENSFDIPKTSSPLESIGTDSTFSSVKINSPKTKKINSRYTNDDNYILPALNNLKTDIDFVYTCTKFNNSMLSNIRNIIDYLIKSKTVSDEKLNISLNKMIDHYKKQLLCFSNNDLLQILQV
jgi:hypothetical protein